LGLTGNIQGTQKVFDVKTGAIKKCRTIRNMPMPQSIITTVHSWAKRSLREEHLRKMVFLNRNKEKYDWDSEDLSDVVYFSEDNPNVHNNRLTELPGVDLALDSSNRQVVSPVVTQSDAERVQTANKKQRPH